MATNKIIAWYLGNGGPSASCQQIQSWHLGSGGASSQTVNLYGAPAVTGGGGQPVNYLYQGARIDGPYYSANYAAASNLDSPGDLVALGSPAPANSPTGFYEAHQGKKVTAVHTGGLPGAWPPLAYSTANANALRANGSFPYYGWGTSAAGLQDILANNSTAKTNLGTFFTAIKNHGHPILFRPLWEMNGGWWVWGIPGGSANSVISDAQYVQIWRNVWQICADVMRVGGVAGDGLGTDTGNVAFHWAPNNFNTAVPGIGGVSPAARFPGTQYVDWMGWQGYEFSGSAFTIDQLFQPVHDLCKSLHPNAPMCIGEFGAMSDITYPGGKAQWFADFFAKLKNQWTDVKMIIYYNESSGSDAYVNVHIENPEAGRIAYANGIADPRFLANVVTGTNFVSGSKPPVP